jgi:Tat protein secretion system quality control protein TatD with DNase activity
MFVDTHCHIHESTYPLDQSEVIERAHKAGVARMICVGTDEKSSQEAVDFANSNDGIYASIGVHPHETKDGWEKIADLAKIAGPVDASAPENFSDELKTFSGAAPRVATRYSRRTT